MVNSQIQNFPDYAFVDTAYNGVYNRNKLKNLWELKLPIDPVDCYQTYFRYSDVYKQYFHENGSSVSGFQGKAYADFIPIDIDRLDIFDAHVVAKNFIQWLSVEFDVYLSSLGIFFSGHKGFHVEIPISLLGEVKPSEDLPKRFKNFVKSFGDFWGFDPCIYEHNRLWRLENTRNLNSGLFKVRLQSRELLYNSIDEISKLAKMPRHNIIFADYYDFSPCSYLQDLWNKTDDKTPVNFVAQNQNFNLDFLKKGVAEGKRNETLFRYARKLKFLKYTEDDAIQSLSSWNLRNCPPLSIREMRATVKSVYNYNPDPVSGNLLHHLRTDPIYRQFNAKRRDIYLQILCHINTKQKEWSWDGQDYHCEPGEMIFSYRTFTNFCASDVSVQNVRSTMKKLEQAGRINIEELGKRRGSKLKLIKPVPTHLSTYLNMNDQHTQKSIFVEMK